MDIIKLVVFLGVLICGGSADPEWMDILDEMIPQYMETFSIPGLAMSFVWGEEVVTRGYGSTSMSEYGQNVTEDTLFSIGSLSKSFTSALLGKYLAENQQTFNTPIYDVVCPRVALYSGYMTNVTTSREMLAHVTGMTGFFGPLVANYGDNITRYDHALRFQNMRHVLPFNSTFFYNNHFYCLAGHLIERLNDLRSWEEIITEDIFSPLGMDRTSFAGDVDYRTNVAYPHVIVDGELVEDSLQVIKAQWNAGPAGSIMSTAADMTKYLRFQLENGLSPEGEQIVPADVMIDTKTPKVPLSSGGGDDIITNYCYGWDFGTYKGYDRLRHSGSFPPHMYAFQTLHQTETQNFGIFAAASGSTGDAMDVLVQIHHFIEDNILLGHSDKFTSNALPLSKSSYSDSDMYNSLKSFTDENSNILGIGKKHFGNTILDTKSFPGEYTHPAFGTIIITDLGNEEFGFEYGTDVVGTLYPKGTPNQYSLILSGTFWSLTGSVDQNTLGYNVNFDSSDGVNTDRLTTDFIDSLIDEYFILDTSLPVFEEIPC